MKASKTKAELKEELKEKLKSVTLKKPAVPPPRYDDVFFEGVAWLDSLE